MSEFIPNDENIIYLMSVPKGRSFFWTLLEDCRVFHPVYSTEHSEMAYLEGKRNIGLKLYADIMRLCPEYYLTMVNEAKLKEDKHNDTSHTNDRD